MTSSSHKYSDGDEYMARQYPGITCNLLWIGLGSVYYEILGITVFHVLFRVNLVELICTDRDIPPRFKPPHGILAVLFDCLIAIHTECKASWNTPFRNVFAPDGINCGIGASGSHCMLSV